MKLTKECRTPMMKYVKTLVLKLNPMLSINDIEDALFWAVYKTREHYGAKRTGTMLRFCFRKDTREMNVKLNLEGKHFWQEAQNFLHLQEKSQ